MDITAEAIKRVRQNLENEADKIKRALVSKTKESMEKYYSYPEGDYYDRTGAFGKAYRSFEQKRTRNINNMNIRVGVAFDTPPVYKIQGKPPENIYASNLSGEHGGNGENGDVVARVEEYADAISTK